jgi:hypothetical protein
VTRGSHAVTVIARLLNVFLIQNKNGHKMVESNEFLHDVRITNQSERLPKREKS